MSLSTIAALALQVGPAAIRGISALLGGNNAADKVADAVEVAHREFTNVESKQAAVRHVLDALPPEQQKELGTLRIQFEKELTERQRIAAEDRQAEHKTTQNTIQSGDNAQHWVVRVTRPLIALISTCAGSYYVITNDSPDLTVASILFALGATYMGLRHREKDKGLTQ
ncbi:hypothetical protein [Vibrio sp. M60_M70]|uniref:hypothetical protein n=1 Tax=Vibrio sp. M60_M70 TaxID=3035166 RepID=UPI00301DFB61